MKKKILLLIFVMFGAYLHAIDLIPNASFENWSSSTYENPTNYPFTSNLQSYFNQNQYNLVKTTDAYNGQYAVKLSTVETHYGSSMGYFINTDPDEGDNTNWTNGILYNEAPTGIRGYYKYNVENADSAMIMITFRKSGASIGDYVFKIGGNKTAYTLFDFQFEPALTEIPDSVIFGATSSDYMKYDGGVAGSVLYLDNVSFTGVSSQPALFNGDFEEWTSEQTPIKLDSWNKFEWQQQGFTRTMDAKDGNYAIELTSFAGDEDDVARNEPGFLTNGYWDNNCGCNKGGIPYTNMIDTLTFWYKYMPMGNDKAEISMQFKKNTQSIDWRNLELDASANYRYMEIPISLQQACDTVIINFISSLWNNKDISYVGSKLTLDKLQFKSQIVYTNLQTVSSGSNFEIYPTSTNGIFSIKNPEQTAYTMEVYSSTGAKISFKQNTPNEINLSNQPTGMYIVRLVSGNKSVNKRIIKN